MNNNHPSKEHLRKTLRAARNALSGKQQSEASINLLKQIIKLPQFLKSKRIAAYLSSDGEINLEPLIHQSWAMGKEVYLPVVKSVKSRELWFVLFTPETTLIQNRFNIFEPDPHQNPKLAAHLLDIVFTPLVGFDSSGNRLGMGGGFYDKTFSFKQDNSKSKPLLIGVAHECQRLDKITAEEWDLKLDCAIAVV